MNHNKKSLSHILMGVAFNVALYCVFDCHRTPEEEPAKSDFQKTEVEGPGSRRQDGLIGIWHFTEGDMTYSGTNYILEICDNRNRLIKSIKHPNETRKLEYEILVKVWHESKSEIFFDLIEVPENNKGGFYPSALKYDRERRIIKNAIEEALVNFEFERISACKTDSVPEKN